MLLKLSINNYAIIDQLSINPDAGLNIVTGETGAGKSIILGALSLILGERADTSVLINKEKKSVVEAQFDVRNNDLFNAALKEAELDEDQHCIIRREISASGKSRAFINDTPVTLGVLHSLTSLLVDLHQQFDNRELENDSFQLEVVDVLAQNGVLKNDYKLLFSKYQQIRNELDEKKNQQTQWQKEADYKQFLLEELEQVDLKADEIENATLQLKQLNASERIITILQSSRFALEENELPINNEIRKIAQQLQSIADVMPDANALQQRLQSVYAETKDIASELERLEGGVNIDPQQLALLEEKVDAGNRLLKKHAVHTTNELLAIQQQLSNELQATLNLHEDIARLEQVQQECFIQLNEKGKELSASRQQIAPQISEQITSLLASVGMPNAVFKIQITPLSKATVSGLDQLDFMLDANKSGNFQPIQKAASGGEMSRIALCIQSLIARAVHLPTLIFDEVDTGISGEAARKVAALLHDLAQYHQIICITHQPQVAAKGTKHFYVFKEQSSEGRINTQIKVLDPSEKVLAIARMIGGENPSEVAVGHAKELIAS